MPYVLVKDRAVITIVNTLSKQAVKALERCPFQWDVIRMYTMAIEQDTLGEISFYTIELEEVEPKKINSAVKKYSLDISKLKIQFTA
jgi:hypothetical protein